MVDLSIFISMDSDERRDALNLLKESYRKDKIDCGNRAERFPQIIEELHRTKGDEITKKFICESPAFANAVLLGETSHISGCRYGKSFTSDWDKF
ncbi:hypothetical protein KY326_01650 [Candidatus Woesearchaeota archaeon]|nr:hypothetical protein [Candidatus Woesearchaeota archaeon]